ncbi:MAG: hypothetical protein B6243_06390 [Anaerolineaceae bacterium 4572_5.2]|nr:MAG: hypothetical protein B6243_06390 [Anaerolineaceae bacterium 4572_5.2]
MTIADKKQFWRSAVNSRRSIFRGEIQLNINVKQGSIQAANFDTIIVNLFLGHTDLHGATGAVNGALDGAIVDLINGGDLRGKLGEIATLYPRGVIPSRRVIVAGLGPIEKFDFEAVREASAAAIKKAQALSATNVASIVHGGGVGKLDLRNAAQALVEGSVLALYKYPSPHKKEQDDKVSEIASLTLLEIDENKIEQAGMVGMKGDMGGGAAVIGAMRAVAQLKLPLRVVGLIPTVENVISATAYKPNDVFVARNGVSVEIISTDAEGRLILADALCYADTFNPAAVIDVATLTGGKVVAFGSRTSALFTTDDDLCHQLRIAGQKADEAVWRMPLDPAYDRQLKSEVADIKNSGGRKASAITAARFLAHFIGNWPWAHLDIADGEFHLPNLDYTPRRYVQQGATGVPTRMLIEFLRRRAEDKEQVSR